MTLRALCGTILIGLLPGCVATASPDEPAWRSGYETGFPGVEWHNEPRDAYAPDGNLARGRLSAWTIADREAGAPVFAGKHVYKGWVVGRAESSHRAYPVVHVDIATPLINSFMVYLDVDYGRAGDAWISLGTWGNPDPGTGAGEWALHTLAIRKRKLEFAHTSPFHGEYIGPTPQPDAPLRRWVRFTAYLVYEGGRGFVQVWQDGLAMLRAEVPQLARHPGTRLRTAHWGMYASGDLDHGVMYNDEIAICTLDAPLTDLATEPRCPRAGVQNR